jgi:parvulin-like peptidyl-prolyl isomerase
MESLMNKNLSRYRARHILLEDLEDAEYVLKKLNKGENFEDLARDMSECESAKKGGDLGRFFSGQMNPQFEKALYNLKEGEISKPIQTEFGFHIIERLTY